MCPRRRLLSFVPAQIKGFPIRGFILIYNKNACFLWKIISFLFHLIAEGLPLIMKNNILRLEDHALFMKFSITFSHIWGSILSITAWIFSLIFKLPDEHQHKPYLSRNPKENSLEVLNRMTSAANCNRRSEKSLGLKNFHAKDWWYTVCSKNNRTFWI